MSDAEGFVPARDWLSLIPTLEQIERGEKQIEKGIDSPYFTLILLGFVENNEVQKPCRTCGQSVHDYRYDRITVAGRTLLSAIRSLKEGASHVG